MFGICPRVCLVNFIRIFGSRYRLADRRNYARGSVSRPIEQLFREFSNWRNINVFQQSCIYQRKRILHCCVFNFMLFARSVKCILTLEIYRIHGVNNGKEKQSKTEYEHYFTIKEKLL